MNTSEIITTLKSKGVQLWAEGDKLRINAPKGAITAQLKNDITACKADILECLRTQSGDASLAETQTACGLSLRTIGQLIGGGQEALPVVDPVAMAAQLKVTFRPLPKGIAIGEEVLQLRQTLKENLQAKGVKIVPWEIATRTVHYPFPVIGKLLNKWLPSVKQISIQAVRAEISAVIDVERPISPVKSRLAEALYQLSARLSKAPKSVADITRSISWAEDHAIQRLEDPTATQVVMLTELDERLVHPEIPYVEKIGLGVNTLVSQFSEIVIGVSATELSILNMNLSDSRFSRSQLDPFILRSLIPKLYVPIAPLPLSRFEIGHYSPATSPYVQKLVALGQSLSTTGLLPSGFKLAEVVRRQSHRDIVSAIVNGRTGVSYGFVAYAEPPEYVGPEEISAAHWQTLNSVEGFSDDEVRTTETGRRYVKTSIGKQTVYKQIPDIWLVCSRSGANKTDLDATQDVLRLGIQETLQLQLPEGIDLQGSKLDIKPSYDTYVMVAIALAAALYTPELIEAGAPIIHFHGYPEQAWFDHQEDYAGIQNPAVPCGTYESGVFNFLSLHQLASSPQRPLSLVGLVEPDHGINLLSNSLGHLLERVKTGVARSQIELGGKHLSSLREPSSGTASVAVSKETEKEPVGGGVQR
ncbi:MAG: hypothetical protein AAFP20_09415 [Cyanobacteria bacterium J06614_10]